MAFHWERLDIFDNSNVVPSKSERILLIDASRLETPLSIQEQIQRNQLEVARLMALRQNEYFTPLVDPKKEIDALKFEIATLQAQINNPPTAKILH